MKPTPIKQFPLSNNLPHLLAIIIKMNQKEREQSKLKMHPVLKFKPNRKDV